LFNGYTKVIVAIQGLIAGGKLAILWKSVGGVTFFLSAVVIYDQSDDPMSLMPDYSPYRKTEGHKAQFRAPEGTWRFVVLFMGAVMSRWPFIPMVH
jgi:hypothetical protein